MTTTNLPRPVVVVPVHKSQPDDLEIVSLRQCGRTLGGHDIVLLAPEGLALGRYHDFLPVREELRVPPFWMESLQAYNRMMISPLVYSALEGYSHMLVHEPDAIVLCDELAWWCSQPYDYIGAPWFRGYDKASPDASFLGVGNFGFSLHRLDAARRVMESWRRWYPFREVLGDLIRGFRGDKESLDKAGRGYGKAGCLRGAWQLYPYHCDIFWSWVVPRCYPQFKIAEPEVAVKFAWEVLPNRCMELCEGKVPFGIHAWAKYDMAFLLPHLEANGVQII